MVAMIFFEATEDPWSNERPHALAGLTGLHWVCIAVIGLCILSTNQACCSPFSNTIPPSVLSALLSMSRTDGGDAAAIPSHPPRNAFEECLRNRKRMLSFWKVASAIAGGLLGGTIGHQATKRNHDSIGAAITVVLVVMPLSAVAGMAIGGAVADHNLQNCRDAAKGEVIRSPLPVKENVSP
jgi:hypothetical protein